MPRSFIAPFVAASLVGSAAATAVGIATRPLPSVPDAFGFAGAFAGISKDHLLAGGGANFPDGIMPWNGGKKVWHDTLYSLDMTDPAAGWRVIGKLPAANGYGVSLTVSEGVLLIGGGDAVHHFKDVWLLNLAENGKPCFNPLPPLPTGLAQMCGALVGRRVHLCGGIENPDATSATDTHWMMDLDDLGKGWQKQVPLPARGRILATAAAIGDTFYVMGGCTLAKVADGNPARTYLRDAWSFSSGEWSRLADLPHPLAASASPAPVSGDSIYLISGDDGSQAGIANRDAHKGFSKVVLRHDCVSGNWSTAGQIKVTPPVTVAVTPWKMDFIFFNGEVRPGVRTPQVFMLTISNDD